MISLVLIFRYGTSSCQSESVSLRFKRLVIRSISHRGKVSSAPNIWTFATYLSLFPQLIAGPIVRYETVADELEHRKETSREIANGIRRFIIGLAKKVLLANILGTLASTLGGLEEISLASSWVHALALTLQLYFDFSGLQ